MATASDPGSDEIIAIANEIRERVRARYPTGEMQGLGIALPDLLPILHARDAAEAKVAAIGSVNPRPAGPVNAAIQTIKRLVARSLNWFVRDQVDFNYASLTALQATLDVLNEVNRALAVLNSRVEGFQHEFRNGVEEVRGETRELKDIRSHWIQWREEWQRKLRENEVHYLRGLATLQSSLDSRFLQADENLKKSVAQQHTAFLQAVRREVESVQQSFWGEIEKVRLDYERMIHNELRVVRQKAAAAAVAAPVTPASTGSAPFDYTRFADRFRGSEEYVRDRLRFYLPYFEGKNNLLDIGCGRGEFLQLMSDAGVNAMGVDLDGESVALCRSKGLRAEEADAFLFLQQQPERTFDGIFASQVIEHLPPESVPALVKLCAERLRPGGVLALETPNPESLAIFASHFFLDPTHTRPVPPNLLVFYYEEFGLGLIEIHRMSPAVETMPSLAALPAEVRDAFFGGLDYAAIGRKL